MAKLNNLLFVVEGISGSIQSLCHLFDHICNYLSFTSTNTSVCLSVCMSVCRPGLRVP